MEKVITFLGGCIFGVSSLLVNSEFSKYLEENNKTIPDVLLSWFIRTPPVAIESETGAEERMLRLKQLLEKRDWKQADIETSNLLHWIIRTPVENNFIDTDLKKLPCRDIKTVDGLWTYYSNGRFGYSAQDLILKRLGNDIVLFGDAVDWRKYSKWVFSYDYDLRAAKGHLPSPIGVSYGLSRGLSRTTPLGAPLLSRTIPLEAPASPNRKPLSVYIPIPKSCETP